MITALEALRRRKGLTRAALAKKAGLAESTVRRCEHGVYPKSATMEKIAAALEWGGEPDQLLREIA